MGSRFPQRWPEIERALDRVLDAGDGERRQLLRSLAQRDAELHREVLELLERGEREHQLLDLDAAAFAGAVIEHLDADDEAGYRPGDRVGAYRLVTPIGSGGMGVVWRAERAGAELSQQVAVKLLRPLAAGGAGVRRFRAERQILASLQHPRIAQVLDAGTTARGEPYLVMELVEGRPITDHCRVRRLGLDQRLRLFEQVLEAVAYAHRRLVVHRDLKPSNIWVTGDGQVKLLDFGIAKLLDPGAVALDAAPETRTGLYLLTPEYAAPEQLRGEPVSTATDVWALGVVLSELLTGRRPFELSGKTPAEIERLVCDTDPRRPSRSLPRGGAGVDPDDPIAGGWRRELRGDLDTVVLTALRRRPEERYGPVEELARDLERYRRGLPIGARPATLAYRTRKFVRRHRAAVAAALLVVLSVIFGVASSLRQAALARAQAARAEAISDFLFDMFDGADPELHPGESITAVELLDAAAEQLDTLDRQPEVRVDVTRILGSLYAKLGQDGRAEALLRRALEQAEAGLGADDRSRIETLAALGSRLTLAGDPDEAAELLAEALRLEERGAFSPGEQIQTRATLALALQQQGKLEQSEALYRRAVAERERLDGSDAAALGSELHGLANLLLAREQWQEAEAIFRRVAEIRQRQLGPEHPGVAVTLWNLAILHEQRDDLEAAEALHRRVLEIRRAVYPGGHPQIARSLSQLARMAQKRGAWDQAEELYQDALDHWQQLFGDDHPHRAVILANLATLRYRTGDFAEAAGYQRRAIAIWRVAYGGEDHKLVAAGAHNLGAILLQIGELEAAGAALTDGLDMRRRLYGDEHSSVALSLLTLGNLRRRQGRLDEALRHLERSVAIYAGALPEDHRARWEAETALGAVRVELGRAAEALPGLQRAWEILSEKLPAGDARLAAARLWLGSALRRLGRGSEARPHVEAALRALEARGGDAPDLRRARAELAALD